MFKEKNSNSSYFRAILKNIIVAFDHLQRVIGFRVILATLLLGFQVAIGASIVHKVYNYVSESKQRDIWAILFLEMEQQAYRISEMLLSGSFQQVAGKKNTSVVEVSQTGNLKLLNGTYFPVKSLQNVGVSAPEHLTEWNLLFYQGGAFVLRKLSHEQGSIKALIYPFSEKIQLSNKVKKETKVYIASRQANLVFASSAEIQNSDFNMRPLVQYFIRVPIAKAQIDLSQDGYDIYGFFNEIPHTNLVIFAETSKNVVTVPVVEMVLNLIKYIGVTIFVAAVVLQICLFHLLKPISALVDLAHEIAKGHFDVKSKHRGLGELNLLTESFHDMATNLATRDKRIQHLMRDQLEKVRLSNELLVAKEIQDSLLPKEPIPPDSGLVIDASYIPASEVAGDWFYYVYDPQTQKTLISVVDVSGHGTGASMYTAITAAMFAEFSKQYFAGRVDEESFFRSLNSNLRKFGKGKWSATGQLFIYTRKTRVMLTINAGHTPPILRHLGKSYRQQSMPSAVMGMSEDFQLSRREWNFTEGSILVVYTDGLSDRMNQDGKGLGIFGIRKILASLPDVSPNETIKLLKNRADLHANGRPPHDDTCIVVVKAA